MNAFTATLIGTIGFAAAASAATITSGNFSIGQGYSKISSDPDPEVYTWNNLETTTNNTLPGGGFTLGVAVTSNHFSSGGPTFVNRVLGNGSVGDGSGDVVNFLGTLTAAYTGVLPGGATNVRTTLVIDSISIYGGAHPAFPGNAQMNWSETTAGNAGTSAPVTLGLSSSFGDAVSYTQVSWNPGEAAVNGTPALRTFTLVADDERYIDGFEVTGHIETSYDLVPEPTSLLGLSFGALLLRRSRRA